MILPKGNSFIKICIHVDDSFIVLKGEDTWNWYLEALGEKYKFREGPLSYFLGMRFNRDPDTGAMRIDQDAQIDKMVRAFGLAGKCTRASTPVPPDKIRPSLQDVPTDPAIDLCARRMQATRWLIAELGGQCEKA